MRAAVVATGVAALAVGCSSGTPAPPEGWSRVEVDRLTLDVPDAWSQVDPIDDSWEHVWELEEDGEAVSQLAVATTLMDGTPSAELLGSSLLENMQFLRGADMEVVEVLPDPPERDGDYYRVRYTYTNGEREFQGVIWAVGAKDAQPVAVRLTGVMLDDETVRTVDEGLHFQP